MAENSATTEQYGISTSVSGITIESETITETPLAEPIPDQQNHTTNEVVYDNKIDLKLTYRGSKLTVTSGKVTYGGKEWFVDSHETAGAYNGLLRYNLSAHRFEKPSSSSSQSNG